MTNHTLKILYSSQLQYHTEVYKMANGQVIKNTFFKFQNLSLDKIAMLVSYGFLLISLLHK